MAWNPVRICLIVGIGGMCTLVFGVVIGWNVVPKVVRSKIADILPLRPDSESWDRWKNLPVPIQYRVYVFKVNNPDEITKGGTPDVTEVGPYVYNEKRIKNIIALDEENGTVSYEQKFQFHFDPDASAPLTEDDVITVVNAPAILFGLIVDGLINMRPVLDLYNTAIHKMFPYNNPLFIDVKVKDFLFGGMPILCNQADALGNTDTMILCQALKILHPKTVEMNGIAKDVHSFAFFKYKNETGDGIYKIDRGVNDVTKIGQIISWNNLKKLSLWKGDACNRILGTDATIFRPYLKDDKVHALNIYHPDVCRSIKLVYNGETEYKGVKGSRYIPHHSFFSSVLEEHDNHCYCPQSVRNITHFGGCLHSGVLELSGCQGAPVIVSYPHFLTADSIYKDGVKGLSPDYEKHMIFVDLEPVGLYELEEISTSEGFMAKKTKINTGYPLRAASRVQINTFLKSITEVDIMKNLSNVLIPTIWMEERVELTDELIGVIKSQLLNILLIMDIIKWLMVGLGAFASVASCAYYFIKIRPRKATEVQKSENDKSKQLRI